MVDINTVRIKLLKSDEDEEINTTLTWLNINTHVCSLWSRSAKAFIQNSIFPSFDVRIRLADSIKKNNFVLCWFLFRIHGKDIVENTSAIGY